MSGILGFCPSVISNRALHSKYNQVTGHGAVSSSNMALIPYNLSALLPFYYRYLLTALIYNGANYLPTLVTNP